MGRGLTSARPRIQGTGPGAAGASGGDCAGVAGGTGAAVCCPSTAFADIDAAIIALTKSRRRISLPVLPQVSFRTRIKLHLDAPTFARVSQSTCRWRVYRRMNRPRLRVPSHYHRPSARLGGEIWAGRTL